MALVRVVGVKLWGWEEVEWEECADGWMWGLDIVREFYDITNLLCYELY